MLGETTFVVMAITFINSLKVYDIVYVMTFGGPANTTQVLGTWMYFLTYNFNRVGLGTAIAVILFGLTLIFAIPYTRRLGAENEPAGRPALVHGPRLAAGAVPVAAGGASTPRWRSSRSSGSRRSSCSSSPSLKSAADFAHGDTFALPKTHRMGELRPGLGSRDQDLFPELDW